MHELQETDGLGPITAKPIDAILPFLGRASTAGAIVVATDALRQVLAGDACIVYALLFGSRARGSARASSDLDIAIGLTADARVTPLALGDLVARLELASGATVDLLVLDKAPPPVAYRVFRDGQVILETNRRALASRKARAVLEYFDFRPLEELTVRGVLAVRRHPGIAFRCRALDRRRGLGRAPELRRGVHRAGGHGVLDRDLAGRLRGAAGLRNLIAHQYGVIDVDRISSIASGDLDDLLLLCRQLAASAAESGT